MAIERERKFLVTSDVWKAGGGKGILYVQGYLNRGENTVTTRVRLAGDKAFLTLKGPKLEGDATAQLEFEYAIPVDDARHMLQTLCGGRIVKKTRYRVPYKGYVWEVDEFLEDNAGLVVAEIEFDHADETIPLPDWAGKEVTEDKRYSNSSLSVLPYTQWNAPAEKEASAR